MLNDVFKATLALFMLGTVSPARADVLSDLADQCQAALDAGDTAAFDAAAALIKTRKDVFNTNARLRAEACLSQGYGEPWEYWFPSSSFESTSAIEAKIQAAAKAKADQARATAKAEVDAAAAEAARLENARTVATLVHASCVDLLARDQVAAMTNKVCVDSFLANGLPSN